MMRWLPAAASLGGLGLAVLAFFLLGPLFAGMIILAALYLAPGRARIVGDAPILGPVDVDVKTVHRYREEHPGATISDAIAATRR
jgi:hypothetical protein